MNADAERAALIEKLAARSPVPDVRRARLDGMTLDQLRWHAAHQDAWDREVAERGRLATQWAHDGVGKPPHG